MIDSFFFQHFIFTDFSTMPMERKFVLQKSLTTGTLSSNIHLILVSKKQLRKSMVKKIE